MRNMLWSFLLVLFFTAKFTDVSVYALPRRLTSKTSISRTIVWGESPSISGETGKAPRTVRQRSVGIASAIISSTVFAALSSASAKVYFDTDVYGDKELKIATVNKMKQKLRNAILQDITVAPDLFALAVNDALGFDVDSEDGGPNGSVLFEKDREENSSFKKAIEVLNAVKKELLRTNTVSLADIVSFAGAEALETVGCPRITVQVGRADAKVADAKLHPMNWSENDFTSDTSWSFTFLNSLRTSGLTTQDIVLLLGGLGEIKRVVAETIREKEAAQEGGDDDEEFEPQPFVPSSFGARDSMYGAKMGKADFSGKYFTSLLKKNSIPDKFGKLLLSDPAMKTLVQKYSTNGPAFGKDLGDSYLRLTLLGASFDSQRGLL